MEQVKYLIVGQGIAGSLLAWEMEKRGWSYRVIDPSIRNTSSNKAAGIYNPITGRKMVKTWKATELFAGLEAYYKELEKVLNQRLIYPLPIYRPFISIDEQNNWQGKFADNERREFIQSVRSNSSHIPGLIDPYGGIFLERSGYVDVPVLIERFQDFLRKKEKLILGTFDSDNLEIKQDVISYGDLEIEKVIFCEGVEATRNKFWKYLSFRPVKGEIIEIDVNFPKDFIVNRHVFMVPKGDAFMVGSTYDHQRLDHESSEAGIRSIENRLKKLISKNYLIKDSWAGIRPATFDRRPFIGLHPEFPQLGIFNGFGTKGVSLIPFFAAEFVNFLSGNHLLTPEVDIDRVLRN